MSRLDFAPAIEQIKVIDVKRGLGLFTPKPDKPASFSALKSTLKKAGYKLASAEITAAGTFGRGDQGWWIEIEESRQRFALEGAVVDVSRTGATPGSRIEVTGDWRTLGEGDSAREIINPRVITKLTAPIGDPEKKRAPSKAAFGNPFEVVATSHSLAGIHVSTTAAGAIAMTLTAPIRTTSPGLTVYKGGGVMPRFLYLRQHLGGLKVDRRIIRLGVSYTPTSTLQLEAEIPYSHTSFRDPEGGRGSGDGPGNVTVWTKYRFYRTLETWGDRQAAFRFGFELPTGHKRGPAQEQLSAPEYVRQQLTPIAGGWAAHFDTSYSQARGRFILGANIEGVLRSERDGFRTGHEARINTDCEYVLLPLKYREPTKELFAILETSYSYHSRGRFGGIQVPGSSGTEFYLAPGLQYVVSPRFVIEASLQFPVLRNTGPLALHTDKSLLVGVRFLY